MKSILKLLFLVGSSKAFSLAPRMYAGTFVSRFGTVATFSAITGGRTVTRAATMLPGQRAVHIVRGGSMSAGEFINETVESSNVAVFSKSYCPFCAKTKALFSSLDVEFTVVELDQRDDGAEIQAALADKTGQRTVPNVFVKGTHVGGNSDVQAANTSGDLSRLLGGEKDL